MLEDRFRGLKMRVPVQGIRVKLIPTTEELDKCRQLGRELAEVMTNRQTARTIDMADLEF